jgi:hypothetical protein
MKFIVEADFPLEPFNTYVRKGTAGQKIAEVLGAIKPEVIYFTDNGVGRGAVMVVELDSASQIPHVTEPLMLNFDASVHYRIAMAPEELQAAGLDRYATGRQLRPAPRGSPGYLAVSSQHITMRSACDSIVRFQGRCVFGDLAHR